MKLTTTGRTVFDMAPADHENIMLEVRAMVKDAMSDQIANDLQSEVIRVLLQNIDNDRIAAYVGMNLDYSRVIEYARNGLLNHLHEDERFNNRMMRLIGNATIGVTNEAVERVTALIEAKSNNNSDL